MTNDQSKYTYIIFNIRKYPMYVNIIYMYDVRYIIMKKIYE